MNIRSFVEKQNKERADNLYNRERSKTISEQYFDYFKTLNDCVRTSIEHLTECIQNYEKLGDDYAAQVPFITPHINILKAYSKMFDTLMANLAENIASERDGIKVHSLLKMRNIDNLNVFFDGFVAELKFVDLILSGAFDVVTHYGEKHPILSKEKER